MTIKTRLLFLWYSGESTTRLSIINKPRCVAAFKLICDDFFYGLCIQRDHNFIHNCCSLICGSAKYENQITTGELVNVNPQPPDYGFFFHCALWLTVYSRFESIILFCVITMGGFSLDLRTLSLIINSYCYRLCNASRTEGKVNQPKERNLEEEILKGSISRWSF